MSEERQEGAANEERRVYVGPPIVAEGETAIERAHAHAASAEDDAAEWPPEDQRTGTGRRLIRVSRRAKADAWYQVIGPDDAGDLYEDNERNYAASPLPAMRTTVPPGGDPQREDPVLLALYQTATSGWTTLTDVRFKLLGLLPAVSIIAWAQILGEPALREDAGPFLGMGLGLAGLVVSFGVWVYDQRNDELYNDMISRARRIEAELGVDTGVFRGRLSPKRRGIDHGTATSLVYRTVLSGWVVVLLWFIVVAAIEIDL